ncbi:hypothetical protein DB330_06330 [Lacticaseibacillus casei]|nr:hypothetical protein [Lacticaseibacillus casei]PTU95754.1 hypothetical protein DB330_06330 [Lacticaseibacillus casei]PTU98374.1 hypothetical protein DB326_06275 [Lacticaseibacillus casei]RXS57490.1 hypothetical protein ETB94_06190 [Lacticaseibacillus casei]TLF34349.1 hypothetical protein FEI10_06345 [Lacticaseibacillus casei]
MKITSVYHYTNICLLRQVIYFLGDVITRSPAQKSATKATCTPTSKRADSRSAPHKNPCCAYAQTGASMKLSKCKHLAHATAHVPGRNAAHHAAVGCSHATAIVKDFQNKQGGKDGGNDD